MDFAEACNLNSKLQCVLETTQPRTPSTDDQESLQGLILALPALIKTRLDGIRCQLVEKWEADIRQLEESIQRSEREIETTRIESLSNSGICALKESIESSLNELNSLSLETQTLQTLTLSDVQFCKLWPSEREMIEKQIIAIKSEIRKHCSSTLGKEEAHVKPDSKPPKAVKDIARKDDTISEYMKRLNRIRTTRMSLESKTVELQKDEDFVHKLSILRKCTNWINSSKNLKPDEKRIILRRISLEISPAGQS
jgi:hypothetical protein